MANATDFKRVYQVTDSTIQRWSAEFADYLSDEAKLTKGQPRAYSDEDARVMALVGEMRAANAPYAKIHAALAAGERADFLEMPAAPETAPETGEARIQMLAAAVAKAEGKLEARSAELDRLIGERDQAQRAAQQAIERAIAAETEVRLLRGQPKHKPAPFGEKAASGPPAEGDQQPAPAASGTGRNLSRRRFLDRLVYGLSYIVEKKLPE